MSYPRGTSLVLCAGLLLLTGCNDSQPKADGRPGTACDAKTWPQHIPDVIGTPLTDVVDGPLLCFNITEAAAPDGHDTLQDPTADTDWIITGSEPAAGTPVTKDQPITLTVTGSDN
ncbi:hypothetical protein [Streptomyces sp. NPDC059819]|uniref:hypothetical protein n=1 Tax=Streptomyces sp. NPDC059819 TaxID=3346963 RepID=UPI0036667B85